MKSGFDVIGTIMLSCVLAGLFLMLGSSIGANKTCKSMGLELHEGKCMKVTREAV